MTWEGNSTSFNQTNVFIETLTCFSLCSDVGIHIIYIIYISNILHLASSQDVICVLWYDNQGLGSNFRTSMSPWPTSTNWQYHTQYIHNWEHFQKHFSCYYSKKMWKKQALKQFTRISEENVVSQSGLKWGVAQIWL